MLIIIQHITPTKRGKAKHRARCPEGCAEGAGANHEVLRKGAKRLREQSTDRLGSLEGTDGKHSAPTRPKRINDCRNN